MTSWPWMKGHSLAMVDPPLDPICPDDKRPAVRDLIVKHRKAIDALAKDLRENNNNNNSLKILFDPQKHDDLWILRFVLSHKGHHKHALDAALSTLHYRAEHKLDEQDIRPYPPGPLAKNESSQRYSACIQDDDFVFDIPHPKRGVVVFLGAKGFDLTKLEQLDFTHRKRAFGYFNEWTHQWLDYTTRTTGRLTKSVRLLDVKGVGLFHVNYKTMRLEGKAAGVMQHFYPQMLESFYICDPPTWAHIPWKVVRPLLPLRIVDKIDFVAPAKCPKERERLRAYLQEEHLPTKYGGQRVLHPMTVVPVS